MGLGGRQVATSGDDVTGLSLAASRDADASTRGWPTVAVDDLQDEKPAPVRRVAQERGGSVDCIDNYVRPAIAVKVADSQPPAQNRPVEPRAGGARTIVEMRARIAEQCRTHGKGRAEPRSIQHVTIGLNQVDPAVSIEIGQRDAKAED